MTRQLCRVVDSAGKQNVWRLSPSLYHYTTRQGLLGIVSTQRIRATEARRLDDEQELEYGFGMTRSSLNTALTTVPVPAYFIGLAEMAFYDGPAGDAYVACFSDQPTSTRHFNHFGQYAIEFDLTPVAGHCPILCTVASRQLFLEQVLYDEQEQRACLNRLLMGVSSKTEEFAKKGITLLPDSLVEQALAGQIFTMKRNQFSWEREWRIVVLPEMDDWWTNYRSSNGIHRVLNRRGERTRFVELTGISDSRLPIRSVICGPSAGDLDVAQVKHLLEENSISVPVRRAPL